MKNRILIKGISFLLFVSLSLGIISCSSLFGLYSDKSIYIAIEDSSYVSQTYGALDDAYKNYAKEHRISDSVMKGIVDNKKLEKDIQKAVNSSVNNKEYKINGTTVSEKFEKKYNDYLEYNNVEKNSEVDKIIEESKIHIKKIYEDKVRFEFGEYYKEYKDNSKNRVIFGTIVFIFLAMVSMISLFVITKDKISFFRNVIYSNISVILVLILFKYYYEKQLMNIIVGLDSHYSNFIFAFVSITNEPIIFVAGILSVITIILLLLLQKEKVGE